MVRALVCALVVAALSASSTFACGPYVDTTPPETTITLGKLKPATEYVHRLVPQTGHVFLIDVPPLSRVVIEGEASREHFPLLMDAGDEVHNYWETYGTTTSYLTLANETTAPVTQEVLLFGSADAEAADYAIRTSTIALDTPTVRIETYQQTFTPGSSPYISASLRVDSRQSVSVYGLAEIGGAFYFLPNFTQQPEQLSSKEIEWGDYVTLLDLGGPLESVPTALDVTFLVGAVNTANGEWSNIASATVRFAPE